MNLLRRLFATDGPSTDSSGPSGSTFSGGSVAIPRPLNGQEPQSPSQSRIAAKLSPAACVAAALPETRISVSRCTSPRSEPVSWSSCSSPSATHRPRASLLPTGSRPAASPQVSRPSSRSGSRSGSRSASRPSSRSSQLAATSGLHVESRSRRASDSGSSLDASRDRLEVQSRRSGGRGRQRRPKKRSLSTGHRPAIASIASGQQSPQLSGLGRDRSSASQLVDLSSVSQLGIDLPGNQAPRSSTSGPLSRASRRPSPWRSPSPAPARTAAAAAAGRSVSPVLRRTSESTLSSEYSRPVGRQEFTEFVQTHLPGLVCPGLFDLVDVRGQGRVSWLDVLDYLLLHARPETMQLEKPFKEDLLVGVLKENRRVSTARLLVVTEPVHTYLTVTVGGAVAMYDASFQYQRGYQLPINARGARSGGSAPNVRVTDAIHQANSMHFVYATTDRALHFYDASATVHLPEYELTGLPDAITCMVAHFDPDHEDAPSLLIVGDDGGDIFILRFIRPTSSLFKKLVIDRKQVMVWQEMSEHSGHVQLVTLRSRHSSPVTSIGYCAANQTIISSAEDDRTSVIMQQLNSKWKDYVFAVPKGVRVLDYSWRRQLLVTGGEDRLLRFWNPVVTARPVAALAGHYSRLVDVAVHEFQAAVISLDMDAVVNIWDSEEHVLLQSVLLESPPDRRLLQPEFGRRAIVTTTPQHRSVLVLFSDVVNQLFVRRQSRQRPPDGPAGLRRLAAGRQERSESRLSAHSAGLRSRRHSRSSLVAVQQRSAAAAAAGQQQQQRSAAAAAEAARAVTRSREAAKRLRRPRPASPPTPLSPSPPASPPPPGDSESVQEAETTSAIACYLRAVAEAEPTFFEVHVPAIPRPARNNLVTNRLMGRQEDATQLVRACTPFKALRLHPLAALPEPGGLPVSSRMRRLGLRCGTLEEVLEMQLPVVPAGRGDSASGSGGDSRTSSLAASLLSLQRQKQRRRDVSRASLSGVSAGSTGSVHSS